MIEPSTPFVEVHCADGGLVSVVLDSDLVDEDDVTNAVIEGIVGAGPEFDETRRGLEDRLEPLGLDVREHTGRHGLVITVRPLP